jgi:hypothetical protein
MIIIFANPPRHFGSAKWSYIKPFVFYADADIVEAVYKDICVRAVGVRVVVASATDSGVVVKYQDAIKFAAGELVLALIILNESSYGFFCYERISDDPIKTATGVTRKNCSDQQ